jgi:hypothetical protein
MLLAQELEVMWGEVDDQQAPPGSQHARRLPDGERRIGQEVQHLMHDDSVGDAIRQAQRVDVAVAHLRAHELGLRQVAARVGKHGVTEIEADAPLVAVCEQLENTPSAGAEVDQQLERAMPQALDDRLLDVVLGDVQGANAVPVGGVRLKIGLCRGFALALQGVGPLPIAGDNAVGAIDEREDVERQTAAGRAVGNVEIGPAAFAEALDQPGLGQELQVPADARLALPEDHRQILDAQLTRGEQQQDAQARRLCRCLERGNNVAAGE